MTLYFNANPKLNSVARDVFVLILNRSQLKDGYVGTYSIDEASGASIRYVYSHVTANGTSMTNILDSWNGMDFQGQLIIDAYDPTTNSVKGTYSVQIKNLINDPTKETSNDPADPMDQCDIKLNGTFSELKIK